MQVISKRREKERGAGGNNNRETERKQQRDEEEERKKKEERKRKKKEERKKKKEKKRKKRRERKEEKKTPAETYTKAAKLKAIKMEWHFSKLFPPGLFCSDRNKKQNLLPASRTRRTGTQQTFALRGLIAMLHNFQ